MAKRAYCSGCGGYVLLDEDEWCPQRHARPCYADIQDLGSPSLSSGTPTIGAVATQHAVAPLRPVPPARRAVVLAGPDGAATRKNGSTLAVVIVVSVLIIVISCVGLGILVSARLRQAGTRPVAQTATPYPPSPDQTVTYTPPTTEQKQRALALCAILAEQNGDDDETLGGGDDSLDYIDVVRHRLADGWGIHNRAQLLGALAWLEDAGQRREFDAIRSTLATGSPDAVAALRLQGRSNPAMGQQISVVANYGSAFGRKSIAAWDYGRYISLCRWGYVEGYLSEDEAWRKIMPVARLMQATFSSWIDYGSDYVVGREFTFPGASDQAQIRVIYSGLTVGTPGSLWRPVPIYDATGHRIQFKYATSPWARLPWDLDLSRAHAGKNQVPGTGVQVSP